LGGVVAVGGATVGGATVGGATVGGATVGGGAVGAGVQAANNRLATNKTFTSKMLRFMVFSSFFCQKLVDTAFDFHMFNGSLSFRLMHLLSELDL
jgi:F0F1-type ATP synthase membrane subunit c/vacuolar-type H+-ATPase subunit K